MVGKQSYLQGIILVILVLTLAGCMQALQTDGSSATRTPVQSTTATIVSTYITETAQGAIVPTETQMISSTLPIETPTTSIPVSPTVSQSITATTAPVSPTATIAKPTATVTATSVAPTNSATPAVTIVLPTKPPLTNMQRWRSQQQNREIFESLRSYTTRGSDLWWYDPVNQQHIVLGSFSGNFDAQAQFTLAHSKEDALEVPYHVNQSYGVTALSPALEQRIQDAGYGEWIETYVIINSEVQSPTVD